MPIFKADHVVPVGDKPIQDGAVAFRGSEIIGIGPSDEVIKNYPDEPVTEFGNSAITPGFVNCHAHLELTAFRGKLDNFDHDFCSWLLEITRLRRESESEESIQASALLGACEAAASGVTSIGDIGRYGGAGLSAVTRTGLRGIIYQETEFSPSAATADRDFEILLAKVTALRDRSTELVSIGISPHAAYTVSLPLFKKIANYSIENKVPLSIHAAESLPEMELMRNGKGVFADMFFREGNWECPNLGTLEYFYKNGILNARPLLAHGIHLTDKEIGFVAESGSRIAHCPKSNAKFGHGTARLVDFLKKGIDVGLGTDSMASNNRCDLLEEARFAGLLSRTVSGGTQFLSPAELFRLATLGGAEAMGIDSETGSLEKGKQADIIVIKLGSVGQQPVSDIYSTLVFSSGTHSVQHVFVGGSPVVEHGVLKNVDDSYNIGLDRQVDEIERR